MFEPFEWRTPARIVFGAGRFSGIGALARSFGKRALIVTGAGSLEESGRLDNLFQQCERAGVQFHHLRIGGEPTVEAIDARVAEGTEFAAQAVVAVGGGSAIDAGKAIAALLANGGNAIDYLEGVGSGKTLHNAALPVIAAPTTAGTGSEATKNAVIGAADNTFKKSMRHDSMLPAIALVDPELTYDCPPDVTAASGMDALTQLIEAYTSRRANPMSDSLAREGISYAAALGDIAGAAESDMPSVRGAMALASLWGGICLANVGLGAVHGLVSPLGAHHGVPHGAGCAALLPAVIEANARVAYKTLGKDAPLLHKYAAALDLLMTEDLSKRPYEAARRLAEVIADANEEMNIPALAYYGVEHKHLPRIVAAGRGNSMKTNPVYLTDEDLTEILEASL